MAKKIRCYMVRDSEGGCAIRYATNNATARREGARELDLDWEEVESCQRAPGYDQYAPGPVPAAVLVEDGWYYECRGYRCNNKVTRYTDERVFASNGEPYCCEECMARDFARSRGNDAAITAMIDLVVSLYPDSHVKYVHVFGDRLKPRCDHSQSMHAYADFVLPGLQHSVRKVFGDDVVWLHADDCPEFEKRYSVTKE